MEEEHCPNPECNGVDSFYRYVVDYMRSTLAGDLGDFEYWCDSDYLQEKYQGIFCSVCNTRVG